MTLESFLIEFAGLLKVLFIVWAVGIVFFSALVLYQVFVAVPRDRERMRAESKQRRQELERKWRGR